MSELILGSLAASGRLGVLLKSVFSSTRRRRLPETPAAVYTPWAVAPKELQNRMWNGGPAENDLMYVALALFPTSRIGLRTDALV